MARDYGTADGSITLEISYAMLFYVLKRLKLPGEPERLPARSQHIVLANREEAASALRKADVAE